MELTQILTFAMVSGLLVMSPGPNGVLIAKTVPTSGRIAGFANITGFVAAFHVHGALSIFGISILLVRSAELFFWFKMAGAAYLTYIGLRALYEAWRGAVNTAPVKPASRKRTLFAASGEGFLTNVLNPKVSMFYLAAFPQFISTGPDSVQSAFLLVGIHALLNIIWFAAMVLLIDRLRAASHSVGVQRFIKGVTGLIFVGFAAKLAAFRP